MNRRPEVKVVVPFERDQFLQVSPLARLAAVAELRPHRVSVGHLRAHRATPTGAEAAAHDVTIEVFSFGSDQPSMDERSNLYVDVAIKTKGSMSGLEAFLDRFINLPYLIDCQMLVISRVDQAESDLIIEARVYVDDQFF